MKSIPLDDSSKNMKKGTPTRRSASTKPLLARFTTHLSSAEQKRIIHGTLLVLFIVATIIVVRVNTLYSRISTRSGIDASPIPKEKKVFNLLIMGYGGPGHDGAYLTDTMMFASIDTEHKRVTLVSIPRDTWVRIPTMSGDEFARKINSVYQTGLFRKNYPDVPEKYDGVAGAGILLKETVADIIGQDLDNYVAVDFSGFKQVVDTLGGVEVAVERSFTDPLYPIDGKENELCGLAQDDLVGFEEKEKIATESPELAYPCRYELLHFTAGTQTMDGATALKFVRSRHSPEDGGDFNRARRQQLFIEALRDRVLSIGFLPKIPSLLNDLENNVRTDMPLELIQLLLKEAPHVKSYTISQVVLTTDNYMVDGYSDDGQYILTSKDGDFVWTSLKRDMKIYLDGKTPVTPIPTLSVSPIMKKSR